MTALDLAAILERAALLDARDYGHAADRLLQVDVPEMAAEIERLWTVEFAHAGCQGLREADNAELIRQRDAARAAMVNDPTRGECTVCGKFIVLKKDGTLRDHVDSNTRVNGWAQRCDGCDQAPRERGRG